jgi:hypothetical protein
MIALILATIITITIMPVGTPEVDWGTLTLDQQMAIIQMARPEKEPVVYTARPASRPASRPIAPADVQTLIETFFQPNDVEWALRVSYCESHWNASAANPRSSARGLFQVMEHWWGGHSAYPGFDPYNPVANTKFAAWLFYNGGPSHWVCK